ncbi:unnamed protein product, partial [Linum tenue]
MAPGKRTSGKREEQSSIERRSVSGTLDSSYQSTTLEHVRSGVSTSLAAVPI